MIPDTGQLNQTTLTSALLPAAPGSLCNSCDDWVTTSAGPPHPSKGERTHKAFTGHGGN